MTSNLKFLGKGLEYPFKFASGGGSSSNFISSTEEGVNHVKQCLLQLLFTKIGERVIRRDFGTDISKLVFEPQDNFLVQSILNRVKTAVSKWEKRIIVNSLNILQLSPKEGKIVISLSFSIINTNISGNLVFPFYLSEAQKTAQAISGVVSTQS